MPTAKPIRWEWLFYVLMTVALIGLLIWATMGDSAGFLFLRVWPQGKRSSRGFRDNSAYVGWRWHGY